MRSRKLQQTARRHQNSGVRFLLIRRSWSRPPHWFHCIPLAPGEILIVEMAESLWNLRLTRHSNCSTLSSANYFAFMPSLLKNPASSDPTSIATYPSISR